MSIRIMNESVSALARGYALAHLEAGNIVVWLELAPQHPKVIGAIWASLVNGAGEVLRLRDDEAETTYSVRGLNRRYERKTVDVPMVAGRARPKFMRLFAPELWKMDAAHIATEPFFVAAWKWRDRSAKDAKGHWRELTPATALAAMLERGTHYPIRMSWGDYLLGEALARGYAAPLIVGGSAPQGYVIHPAPWADIVSDGIRSGQIFLNEQYLMPIPAMLPARPALVEVR